MTGNGIEVILEELRRLRSEGVDRVFVEDATLRLVRPHSSPARSEEATPASNSVSRSAAPASTAEKEDATPADPAMDLIQPERKPDKDAQAPPPSATGAAAHAAAASEAGSKQRAASGIPEAPPRFEIPEGTAGEKMEWLRERVENCPVCQSQLNPDGRIVFGTGSENADIFFCGEAPGADEEKKGEPFVGRAGELLDKIIAAMTLDRESVYIGNILKWRPRHDKPYGNRPPTADEMQFCMPYLRAQIRIVAPKVIVALGRTAATGLLGLDHKQTMGAIRGTWHSFEDTPVMVTFHPSYLLRNATLKTKRMVWEDMLAVMEFCGHPISERQRGYFLSK